MPYMDGKVREYKNTTQQRGTSPRPKLRPENFGTNRVVDVSPNAEAGDQFFVQEAMRRKQKANMKKK